MTVNISSILANAAYLVETGAEQPGASVVALFVCLIAALLVELVEFLRETLRTGKTNFLFWLAVATPFVIYAVAIPIVNSIVHSFDAPTTAKTAKDPGWSIINEVSFRSAKYAVFGLFTYLGACLGSFLNVVAYSLPRGGAIGLRDSSCPNCKATISRIDNLPIFSYLNLGGKCRNCKVTIPLRYLSVEVIAAFIFGSLFLYELVTGCANIPNFKNYIHTGVLWMILYPKWPVIGIYVLHVFFMTGLLTMALIEWDNQKLKWWILVPALLVPIAIAASLPVLHPVQFVEKFPFKIPWNDYSTLHNIISPIASALIGFLFGSAIGLSPLARNWEMTAIAFAICAAVLGWQGFTQVTIVFALLMAAGLAIPQTRGFVSGRSISVLLAAVMLHHPFWKMLFQLW